MRSLPAGPRGGCGGVGQGCGRRRAAALAACAAARQAVSTGARCHAVECTAEQTTQRDITNEARRHHAMPSTSAAVHLPRAHLPAASPSRAVLGQACELRAATRAAPRPHRRAPAGRLRAPQCTDHGSLTPRRASDLVRLGQAGRGCSRVCSGLAARGAAPGRGSAVQTLGRRTEAQCAAQVMAEEPTADALLDAALQRIGTAQSASISEGLVALVSELRAATEPDLKFELCCRVVDLASADEDTNIPLLVECGAVEALLVPISVSAPVEQGPLVAMVFIALASLAPKITNWRDELVDMALQEAVKALRGPLALDLRVSQQVCTFLSTVVMEHPTTIVLKICNVDAVEALAATMQRFLTSEAVQLCVCKVLLSLALASGLDSHVRHAIALRVGLKTFLTTMKAFPDAASLLHTCICALALVVEDINALQMQFVRLGGVETVSAAMTHHEADAEVAASACHMFKFLGKSFKRVNSRAAAVALDAVLAALRTHTGDLNTQLHGIGSLCAIVVHDSLKHRAASMLPLVLTGMEAYRDDTALQSVACMALTDVILTVDYDIRADAGAAGAIVAVSRVLRLCIADGQVLESNTLKPPCAALFVLLQGSTGYPNQLRAVHAGFRNLLQAAQSKYGGQDEDVDLMLLDLIQRSELLTAAHAADQPGCSACAAMRVDGRMCGRAGCFVRWRANGSSLSRCARCQRVAYCCPEHQREAWRASHKAECIARAAR